MDRWTYNAIHELDETRRRAGAAFFAYFFGFGAAGGPKATALVDVLGCVVEKKSQANAGHGQPFANYVGRVVLVRLAEL